VVGARDDVEYVIEQISRNPGAGYRVDGAAIDDEGGAPVGGLLGRHSEQVRIVARLDDVALAAQTMDVDAVVVAGHPRRDGDFVKSLAWQLEGSHAELVLASRLADVAGPRIHFRPVEGLPLVHVELPQFEGGKHVVKRGLDIVVSAIALLLLLPAFAILAVLVRHDSPGPAFFSQARVGRNGKTFRMFKFRSMAVDAESRLDELIALNEGAGALFKLRSDPRVTGVGRVIRKYSLDELPQLWNVLIGDMSLVGPRPPLQREVEVYENRVCRRLFIKPGLTGMWQVNGRSDLDWEEGVRLDLYYVENWSLTGDLVLLWRTVKVLLNSNGAY
jgi:exopolysaccharide biosynthesis polyprenyl glycosylphosphotransferase